MTDKVFAAFLARQREEGMALAAASDLLELIPVDALGQRYLADFRCTGLIQTESGHIVEADRFARLTRYRGDLKAEWDSYSPDARQIADDFEIVAAIR